MVKIRNFQALFENFVPASKMKTVGKIQSNDNDVSMSKVSVLSSNKEMISVQDEYININSNNTDTNIESKSD